VNSFLLTLTALLILVLGALFAAPLIVDWNDYRPVFEQQATKLLGREVKVGGKVHMTLLPAPELRFDDVKVADEAGHLDQPLLEARSIEALLNIGALLGGSIEARQLTISDPILRLKVNADGSGNWSDVGRPGEALPFVPKEVSLDQVSVTGGRIELAKGGEPALTLENVEGEASATSLAGPYKVSTSYTYAGRRQELHFSTSTHDASGTFRLKSALRDPTRNTVYLLDGDVAGLGATPAYDGNIIVRIAGAAPAAAAAPVPAEAPGADPGTAEEQLAAEGAPNPEDVSSTFELKGELHATPDHAEFPTFDLTIHAKGRPQLLKGKLALDFGPEPKTVGELAARWVDIDALLAALDPHQEASPAAALRTLVARVLAEAASIGQGSLAVAIDQASLGGDLVGNLNLDLSAREGRVTIGRLTAELPGENRIEMSGDLADGEAGPVFTGPIKLDGSKLRTLNRWAAGDRQMSGQATIGKFTLQADAIISDGAFTLDHASGELSDTKFSGALRYRGGEKRTVDLTLDSDRLDLRELLGGDTAWRSWLPASTVEAGNQGDAPPNLLAALRDDDMHVALRVGELLLPDIPAGKLDAKFSLASDTLDVERLDFDAAGAVALNGQGRIERLSEAPSGKVDFALQAATADGLRVVGGLAGLPESLAHSKHLQSLAPLDIHVGLTASREGAATRASLELSGKAAGSDVSLIAKATGEPVKLALAEIDIDGAVTGDRAPALLGLLFPGLPQNRLSLPGEQGRLTLKLHGVPRTGVTGRAELSTPSMTLAFDGQGSLHDEGVALNGKAQVVSSNAGLALLLLGLEASPSATGAALNLHADLVTSAQVVDLKTLAGDIAGEPVQGTAHVDFTGDKTTFTLNASAGSVSLPALLGSLVAWERTPATEELLGAVGRDTSEVWPARGFALGPLGKVDGAITLSATKLTLGFALPVEDATLAVRIDSGGLSITDLKGRLFGGAFTASGTLSARGAGASLAARAELTGGKLEALSKTVVGPVLARGPFSLAFEVTGDGLSPPGLVAGLSGQGTLALEPGMLQALSSEPLKRMAAEAAKSKKIKADKDQIAALSHSLRDRLTHGTYKYAAATFPFEVKNGTLRLKPTTLASADAETLINGYVELASLRLDSEWVMTLPGGDNVPSVSVVFAGPLSDAGTIAPAIDAEALENYLTMRRMQEDVERLETLDVSGKTKPPIDPQVNDTPVDAQLPAADNPSAEVKAAEQKAAEQEAAEEKAAKAKADAEAKVAADAKAAEQEAAKERAAKAKADSEAKVAADAKAAEQKATEEKVAKAKADAEAKVAADAKAAEQKAAEEKATKAKAAADAKAAAEVKAAAEAKAAAESKAADLQQETPGHPASTPSGGPPEPNPESTGQQAAPAGPEGSPGAASVSVDGEATSASPTDSDATTTVVPTRRPHRPPSASDDWKKGIGIFGGG
jgi:hypothetical protein